MRSHIIVVGLVLSLAGHASAQGLDSEEPDPSDEKTFRRDGFAIGVGVGPSLLLGTGSQSDIRGGGGSFSLRFGTSAGEKLLWFVQLDTASRSENSVVGALSVAAHYYLRETFWVRGGLGLGNVTRRSENGSGEKETDVEGGLNVVGGAGVDLFRRGSFALDLELSLSRGGHGDGTMNVLVLQMAANWY